MEGYQQHPFYQEQEAAGDRFPQWSAGETKEFLAIRAELDRAFMETKRNKALWEVMATRLKEMGFARTAEQCKSKWKNLVTRYKGCETMEPEALRQQFPYYNELHAIFSARLHHMLWTEAEGSTAAASTPTTSTLSKKKKSIATTSAQMSSDEDDDDVEERESIDDEEERKKLGSSKSGRGRKKRKVVGDNQGDLREVLERFMKEEEEREARWMKRWEAREEERRKREETWRQKMEALEAERRGMERSWREKEELRRVREEARAIKRDALINQLLNRLSQER